MNRMFGRRGMGLVAPLLMVLGGCVGMEVNPSSGDGPPTGKPCQMTAIWDHDIHFTADPTHGGAQTPALAGRIYFWGPVIDYPMAADGTVTVLVYDGSAPAGPEVRPLQAWIFNPTEFHTLLKRDFIGWGYTVPLVWPDLPHTLQSVRVKVCYQPAKGAPLYTEGEPMTIELPTPNVGPVVTQSAKPRGN